jgi:crossover junction endodeoxyribonuclease RuvC
MPLMRIIGIDPGSRKTGFGVIECTDNQAELVHQGVINAGGGDFPERLGIIFSGLREVITEFRATEASVESVFMSHNAASALKLGQARGAAVCAAGSMGLAVAEYSPRSVKQAIVGRGSAEKTQVQHMVNMLLRIDKKLAEDAADALAVALCHQHTQQTLLRMARMQG